jgi:GABA(A) receptor-associated protein
MQDILKLRCRYPDRVPVKLERSKKCMLPLLEKENYLVNRNLTLGDFTCILRKHMSLTPSQSIIIFVNNELLPFSETFDELDHRYSNNGIITLRYTSENVFG